jgi:phosphohistidine phosphatase
MRAEEPGHHTSTVNRRLVLLRHAKAEPGTGSMPDVQRPLALNGRKQAARVGMAFMANGLVPELAVMSPALRTRQTWELAAAHIEPPDRVRVDVRDELYEASVGDVLDLLREIDPGVTSVLVIGHEPTIAATAAYLAAPGSDDAALAQVRVGVPTATYSVLESADLPWSEWGKGAARLLHVGRPS